LAKEKLVTLLLETVRNKDGVGKNSGSNRSDRGRNFDRDLDAGGLADSNGISELKLMNKEERTAEMIRSSDEEIQRQSSQRHGDRVLCQS